MFIYHGEHDPMINLSIAKMTYKEFIDQGFNMTMETEKGLEHSLSVQEIKKLGEYLRKLMK